ncbi:hypothetical protein [Thauera humireducens]|uniref:Uncharacterized protein n=1 Tax=Thauera humireducens TaxID=1134435 RepID=A0A127K4R8_9RHOO|nr:hypothetical protein [Thauera humireducens]AMO36614.1 hypothetical protein AC731_006460 [Thauera humireducens]
MANPVPLTYTSPVQRVGGGREVFPNRLLDLLAGIADGQWVKANTNTFKSIWPRLQTPNYGPGFGYESYVINAWSSMAWDSKRSRIYLWGGGHANTDDNALYVWDGETGQWGVGYYAARTVIDAQGSYNTPDGHMAGPVSSHTYSGNNYLPVLDRFYTHGGAAQEWGGGFRVWNAAAGQFEAIAGYLCQLDLVGKGFVGGSTGSNWMRAGAKALPGARPWEVLDYVQRGVSTNFSGGISGGSDVRVEGGVDVIYKVGQAESAKTLRKITMPSLDVTTHTVEAIGRMWSLGMYEDLGCALDRNAEIMFVSGWTVERFWDLKTASPTNNWKEPTFSNAEVYAQYVADRQYQTTKRVAPGCASDDKRGSVFVWLGGGRVYRVDAPAGNPTPTAGWSIEIVADETTVRPMTKDEIAGTPDAWRASVWGKWKYAADLDCYVGMQHPENGDVWLWRPPGWIDPRGI